MIAVELKASLVRRIGGEEFEGEATGWVEGGELKGWMKIAGGRYDNERMVWWGFCAVESERAVTVGYSTKLAIDSTRDQLLSYDGLHYSLLS